MFYLDEDGQVRKLGDESKSGTDEVKAFSPSSARGLDSARGRHVPLSPSAAVASGAPRTTGWASGGVQQHTPMVTYEDMTEIEALDISDVGDEIAELEPMRKQRPQDRGSHHSETKSSPRPTDSAATPGRRRRFNPWGSSNKLRSPSSDASSSPRDSGKGKAKKKGGGWKFWKRGKRKQASPGKGSGAAGAEETTLRTFSGRAWG